MPKPGTVFCCQDKAIHKSIRALEALEQIIEGWDIGELNWRNLNRVVKGRKKPSSSWLYRQKALRTMLNRPRSNGEARQLVLHWIEQQKKQRYRSLNYKS
jgi:hypothetical protein